MIPNLSTKAFSIQMLLIIVIIKGRLEAEPLTPVCFSPMVIQVPDIDAETHQ